MGTPSEDETLPGEAAVPGESGGRGTVQQPRGSSGPAQLQQGSSFGRYAILGLLGRGAMGVVYAAFDPELDRRIAIKVMRSGAGSGAQPGLVREAKAMARLSHRNVITVFEVGVVQEAVFIAMEYIDGQTLKVWLAGDADGSPSVASILSRFRAAGEGLAAAHDAKLVHRDFKPDNVMLAADGRVVILDFGLAASRSEQGGTRSEQGGSPPPSLQASTLTATGEVVGTPAYMSPEQAAGLSLEAASDQFSFCVSLYEAVYGELPFKGETLNELMAHIVTGEIREEPSDTRVPRWLRAVLVRGLARQPDQRYGSMRALLTALDSDPSRRRRRVAGIAAVAGLAALTIAAAAMQPTPEDPCADAAEGMVEVWNPAVRSAVHTAFSDLGVSYARTTADRLLPSVDAYAQQWQSLRGEACVAHEATPDDDIYGRRLICLDHSLYALERLVVTLREPDTSVARQAVAKVGNLPALDLCANAAYLLAATRPPDPEVAAEVRAIGHELADVLRRSRRERTASLRDEAQRLTDRARASGYGPIVAGALLHQAWVERNTRGSAAAVDAFAFEALLQAERVRDDRRIFDALSALAKRDLDSDRPELAQARLARAEVALERLGTPTVLRLALLRRRAEAATARQDPAAAVVELEQAVQIRRETGSYDTVWAVPDVLALVDLYMHSDRRSEAQPLLEHALAVARVALGPEAPAVGTAQILLGNIDLSDNEPAAALVHYAEADRIYEASRERPYNRAVLSTQQAKAAGRLGDLVASEAHLLHALDLLHADLSVGAATIQTQLGRFYLDRGRLADAQPHLEGAVQTMAEKLGEEHNVTHFARAILGDHARASGLRDEAAQLYQTAVDGYEDGEPGGDALVLALTGLAELDLEAGRTKDATARLTRAIDIEIVEDGTAVTPRAQFALARARHSAGNDEVGARALAQSAATSLSALGTQPELHHEVVTWLEANARPRGGHAGND